jgi:hypothetical protein
LIENGYRQQEILIKENFRDKVGGYIFTKDGVIQRHQDEDLMKKIKKQQQKEERELHRLKLHLRKQILS